MKGYNKTFKKVFTIAFSLPLLTGCSVLNWALFQSSVEEFGDVHFLDSGLPGCVDWLIDGETIYYFVSTYEGRVKYKDPIGAFNENTFGDKHGYTVYPLDGEEYKGIVVLEEKPILGTIKWLYVSDIATSIPVSLLFDIPHKDNIFDSGRNFKLNGEKYSTYGSTKSLDKIRKGEMLGSVNSVTYYQVEGYDDWVCSENQSSSEYLDLSYKLSMTELPAFMVMLTKEIH